MLDVQIWGMNPAGHHVTNLLLHILNTLLLFFLLSRITGYPWRSAFVAALFAVHPLHVESVAWVAERKDVLSTAFWLLTTLAYVRYVRIRNEQSKDRHSGLKAYLLVMLLYALGLMAKPMLVTLPLALLLLDYWPLGRFRHSDATAKRKPQLRETQAKDFRRLAIEKAPLLALACVSCLVTFLAQLQGAVTSLEEFPVFVRLTNAFVSYIGYLIKMLWPSGLAPYYPHPGGTIPIWQYAGSFMLVAVVTVAVIRRRRSLPYLAFGWLWYALTLVPVIGFVQVGSQAMADRYTYVPLIGISVIIAWGLPDLLRRREALCKALAPVSVAVLLVLCILTWRQAGRWKDSATLFTHALAVTENSQIAHHNLGLALAEKEQYVAAEAEYHEALKIDPHFAEAYANLGYCLLQRGKLDEAIDVLRISLKTRSTFAETHSNLGLALLGKGRTQEAVEALTQALRLDPVLVEAHNNMGMALASQRKLDEAMSHYREALRLRPGYAQSHCNLGLALAERGRMGEAAGHLLSAIRSKPDYAEAHFALGSVLLSQGKRDEAIRNFREAVRIRPGYAAAHVNLAVLLYDEGRHAEAWKEVRLSRQYGGQPNPEFLKALKRKMPEPRQ